MQRRRAQQDGHRRLPGGAVRPQGARQGTLVGRCLEKQSGPSGSAAGVCVGAGVPRLSPSLPQGPPGGRWPGRGGAALASPRQRLASASRPDPVSSALLARDEFNIQVLHAFVGLHEFTDLNLVQALR